MSKGKFTTKLRLLSTTGMRFGPTPIYLMYFTYQSFYRKAKPNICRD